MTDKKRNDDVDTSEPQEVEDGPQNDSSSDDSEKGEVVGRRNPDLPTENLTTPPAS